MEIPYCIVKGKARLGTVIILIDQNNVFKTTDLWLIWLFSWFMCPFWQIVHKKTASVLCLTTVKNEDKMEFSRILEAIKVA